MDGFVGREKELEFLEDLWDKVPMSCAVSGRRHLGKTALLRRFSDGKDCIYISGEHGLRSSNLASISAEISRFSGRKERISDAIDILPRIKEVCGKRKVLVIIDRFSDLLSNFEEMNTCLRSFMNRDIGGTRILLVVCDSDSSLFGRFYYSLELKPMKYRECVGFHPGYSSLQQLKAYAMVGGTPAYHKVIGERDPDDVMRFDTFDHMSVLSLDVEGMVHSEAMMFEGCYMALSAMAHGAESLREISSRADISSSFCSRLLDDLEHKGMVSKEVSSGLSRRAVYSISSNILNYYYRVVLPRSSVSEFEGTEAAYVSATDSIRDYIESSFKTLCMDYVAESMDFKFVGKLRRKDDSADDIIDFVAMLVQKGKNRVAVARCRLYGDPLDEEDLYELKDRAKRVEGSGKLYMMFSGCGFSNELSMASSKASDVKLYTLDDLYLRSPSSSSVQAKKSTDFISLLRYLNKIS